MQGCTLSRQSAHWTDSLVKESECRMFNPTQPYTTELKFGFYEETGKIVIKQLAPRVGGTTGGHEYRVGGTIL